MQGVEQSAGARPVDGDPPGMTLLSRRVAGSERAQEKGRQRDTSTKSQPLLSSRRKKQTMWGAACKGLFGTQMKCLTTEPCSLCHGTFSLAHHLHAGD